MNVRELKTVLAPHPDAAVRFVLPDGEKVAAHAHVTEVARVQKRFVDCGGTRREDVRCQMQTWVAEDFDHRLTAGKLLSILNKAEPLLESGDLLVDVEHETKWTSQFPLESVVVHQNELLLQLGVRHTACLAPEKCVPKRSALTIDFGKLPTFIARP